MRRTILYINVTTNQFIVEVKVGKLIIVLYVYTVIDYNIARI